MLRMNVRAALAAAAIAVAAPALAASTTVQGEPLTATMKGGKIALTGAKGGMAMVTIKDVAQSNGVIHLVDSVLMP